MKAKHKSNLDNTVKQLSFTAMQQLKEKQSVDLWSVIYDYSDKVIENVGYATKHQLGRWRNEILNEIVGYCRRIKRKEGKSFEILFDQEIIYSNND